MQRFFREAQAAGKLAHPGIVTVFDVGEEESSQTPYIVMEYISGVTMEAMTAVAASGAVAPHTALELTQQVAEALHYAHAQGIVHRDIKPANIIVTGSQSHTEAGRAKVTDFGVAKLTLTEFTVAGQVLGTPSYMSPEQLTGEAIDGRSDLFSLGVVLYILLTGSKPFPGESVGEITYKVVNIDPVPATQLNAALTPEFDYVLSRALAKSPASRYQSGNEFAHDLQDVRAGLVPRSRALFFKAAAGAMAGGTVRQPAAERTVAAVSVAVPEEQTSSVGSVTMVLAKCREKLTPWWNAHNWKFRAAISLAPLLIAAGAFVALTPHSANQAISSVVALTPSPVSTPMVSMPTIMTKSYASLRVRGTHPFHNGALALYLDGKLLRTIPLRGAGVRKKYQLFKTPVIGRFDQTLSVPGGDHKVRVQVTAGSEYDQSQEIEGDFSPNLPKTLRVAVHLHELQIEWL